MCVTLQILPDGDQKPQAKHVHTRAEYLLKALSKHLDQQKDGTVRDSFFYSSFRQYIKN